MPCKASENEGQKAARPQELQQLVKIPTVTFIYNDVTTSICDGQENLFLKYTNPHSPTCPS
jgi:hypothetical protein